MKAPLKRRRIRDERVYDQIMEAVSVDFNQTVRPEDVARQLYYEQWQTMLPRVRLFARKLAQEGYLQIIRKGEVADPDDFKGLYRLQATPQARNYVTRCPETDEG